VHPDDVVEVVVGHLPQHAVAQDAGVGAHHVQPAELRDRPVHQPLGRLGVTHRGHLGHRAAARRDDLLDRRLGRGRIHIVDHDRGPGGRQRLGVGQP
jgi:hypothetical protein